MARARLSNVTGLDSSGKARSNRCDVSWNRLEHTNGILGGRHRHLHGIQHWTFRLLLDIRSATIPKLGEVRWAL